MPTISEILDSIQVPALIKDPIIKTGTFMKNSKGFQFYSGGFTVVFPVTVGVEKWAFRCWHIPIKDSKKRYSLISNAINESKLPYFCSFDYLENGIIVNGESYPTTKMRWVDGKDLKKYICTHYHDSIVIKKLAQQFLVMISELHQHKIAHGDLQHGNILVSDTGQIFLVDYDSMYVPEMKDQYTDIITGLIDYQHPSRKNNTYSSEKLDFFSEVIIYTSLLAIAEQPDLVDRYNVENTESLLFTSSDFESFSSSKIYKELKSLNNLEIDKGLEIIENYLLETDINQLNPIESYLMSIDIDYPKIVPNDEQFQIKWTSEGVDMIEVSGYGKVKLNGTLNLKLSDSKDINFNLFSKNGYNLKRTIHIKVIKRAIIKEFKADRQFSYPNLPIKLSWEVENATAISIDNFRINKNKGSFDVNPGKDTTYTLKAKDKFGNIEQTLTINMLPLPAIKSILVPVPQIEENLAIAYTPPKFEAMVPVPTFESSLVRLDVPQIPNLRTSSYFVHQIQKRKKRKFKNPFKTLYSYFFGK